MMNVLKLWSLVLCAVLVTWTARSASAHPMGNFSINHYARFEAKKGSLALRYILDFAEIPTADRMAQLDRNGDNTVSASEKNAYLKTEARTFLNGLALHIDGRKVALTPQNSDLEVRAGAGGLPTLRVWVDTTIPLPSNAKTSVVYNDTNFEGRTGWMEVIAVADKGHAIRNSNAATTDQSRGLTVFPLDAGVVPPRQSSATFTLAQAGTSETAPIPAQPSTNSPASTTPTTNDQTPQNRFTQSIAEHTLTPGLVLLGIAFAFAFGAVHALSPGHGKTMVAAYLVGSRGTPRHAVLLGLVVTITHTFGVFALGLALLFASRYIVPEKLFPALSALSGLLIFGVGLWLFMSRWQGLSATHAHAHDGHTHSQDGHSHDDHAHAHDEHSHTHDHSHDEHSHEHGEHSHTHTDGGHTHSHGAHPHGVHTHSHGGRAHSHDVPDGPITMKTLVALGISGGIVPCPEALVVLLAAVKLHRIGYGMVLITAFSVGLAAALIAIGMLVVSMRQRLSRFDAFGESSPIVRFLPLASAAVITLIGAVLTLRAAIDKP